MITLLCAAFLAIPAGLTDLFDKTNHDFGTVPANSVTLTNFVLKNTTSGVIQVANVRSSCHCATPRAVNHVAHPGQEIVIEVAYDARKFTGSRSMTITVTFSQPSTQAVQLRITGFASSDISISPGEVDFGVVRGQTSPKQTRIESRSNANWKLTGIEPTTYVNAELGQPTRAGSGVGYSITLSLRPDLPPGQMAETVFLRTNDPARPTIQVQVKANLQARLAASPNFLRLEGLTVGTPVTRKVILKADEAFEIVSVGGDTAGISFRASTDARNVHVLTMEITAKEAGTSERNIFIRTNLAGEEPLPFRVVLDAQADTALSSQSLTLNPTDAAVGR